MVQMNLRTLLQIGIENMPYDGVGFYAVLSLVLSAFAVGVMIGHWAL